jgi:dTMP kinase
MAMEQGRFITFEGIEGVGKSTNISYFVDVVEKAGHKVLTTREPGGTPMAERIRALVAEHGDEAMPDIAELLLVFAARSLHVNNVILPALASGTWVVCDRFTDSSRAYQGGGRGLPQDDIDLLADWVHGGLQPDLTVLLDAPVETGMSRAGQRSDPDRFESEQSEFFQRVRATYLQLAESHPERFAVIDATRSLEDVTHDVGRIATVLIESKNIL